MLDTLRKPLGALSLIVALVLLAAYYLSVAYADFPDAAWHVVDILVIVAIALTVLVNVVDSIHVRRDPSAHLRQLPRDAITVVAAFVLMLFLHNSLLFARTPRRRQRRPLAVPRPGRRRRPGLGGHRPAAPRHPAGLATVIPAKAGIHIPLSVSAHTPASAGMMCSPNARTSASGGANVRHGIR